MTDEAYNMFSFSLYTYYGFENDGQGFPMLSGGRDCLYFIFFNSCSVRVFLSTLDLGL